MNLLNFISNKSRKIENPSAPPFIFSTQYDAQELKGCAPTFYKSIINSPSFPNIQLFIAKHYSSNHFQRKKKKLNKMNNEKFEINYKPRLHNLASFSREILTTSTTRLKVNGPRSILTPVDNYQHPQYSLPAKRSKHLPIRQKIPSFNLNSNLSFTQKRSIIIATPFTFTNTN